MQTFIENTPPGPRARADRTAIPGWGADLDKTHRPGHPMERTPPRLPSMHWSEPAAQPHTVEVLTSVERPGITPVFGTPTPPRGLSGVLRRLAFKASESDLRHWMLLLLADRIDMVEGVLEDLARGHIPNVLGEMGAASEWRHNRPAMLRKLALLAALAAAAALIARSMRSRSETRALLR